MPKLTKSIVDRAEVPPKGQAFVWCSEDRGFGVRINASGSRTFIAQGRINGKERRACPRLLERRGAFDACEANSRNLVKAGAEPQAAGIAPPVRIPIADQYTFDRQ